MFEKFLPLSIEGDWRTGVTGLPDIMNTSILLDWLFENGSLTQKLKNHCSKFSVKVLSKHERLMTPCECVTFGVGQPSLSTISQSSVPIKVSVQVREVLLYCDGVPWVYGQTLMPLDNVPANIAQLITLGEKPLGELIFNQPGVERGGIEVAFFEFDAPVCQFATQLQQLGQYQVRQNQVQLSQPITDGLCGRRSLFSLDGYSLLVAEVFLPFSGIYS